MWRSGCWKRIEHLASYSPTLRALRSLCGGGLKVVTGCGQPGGPSAPPSPLPARSGSRPTTRKSPKGPPLSVAAGLLFAGHSCLIQEGGLTCQESLAVGVGGLKGVLWGGSSEPLQSLPQVGTGAPQASHALELCKAVDAHLLPSCTPIGKTSETSPLCLLPVMKPVFILHYSVRHILQSTHIAILNE